MEKEDEHYIIYDEPLSDYKNIINIQDSNMFTDNRYLNCPCLNNPEKSFWPRSTGHKEWIFNTVYSEQ